MVFASCSTSRTLRPMLDGYPGTLTKSTSTALFQIPQNWITVEAQSNKYGSHSHGRYSIIPKSERNTKPRPVISILFSRLDPTAPATEAGQAESHLSGIHSHYDDKVIMDAIETVDNQQHGTIPIHYLHSSYYGYRLYAVLVRPPLALSCELTCRDPDTLAEYRPAFEELVKTMTINE